MPVETLWTAGAERDLIEIHGRLHEVLEGADDLLASMLERPLEAALRLLGQHPELGARVKGATRFRRWLLGPRRWYGLFYVVESRGIVVHALLDVRQDPRLIRKRLGF